MADAPSKAELSKQARELIEQLATEQATPAPTEMFVEAEQQPRSGGAGRADFPVIAAYTRP